MRPIWRSIAASEAFSPRRSRHGAGLASRRTTGPESESGPARMSQATKEKKRRIKELERELARKDRALTEIAALSGDKKKAGGGLGG